MAKYTIELNQAEFSDLKELVQEAVQFSNPEIVGYYKNILEILEKSENSSRQS